MSKDFFNQNIDKDYIDNCEESCSGNGSPFDIDIPGEGVCDPPQKVIINYGLGGDTPIDDVVFSVNGISGHIILDKTWVGLGQVDNTSDFNKPISRLTQQALDLKISSGDNVSLLFNDAGYITVSDIPDQVQVDWNSTSGLSSILNKPDLSIYAKIGDNISIFNNDAGYITLAEIPPIDLSDYYTKTETNNLLDNKISIGGNISDLINNVGYITSADIPSAQTLTWIPNSGNLEISGGNAVILDGRYSLLGHTHTISDIIGLQLALDGKENAFAKGSIIQGNGISITGTLANRLVGSGNITISNTLELPEVFERNEDGLVPQPGGSTTTRFLREDGSWVAPINTTYTNMSSAEIEAGTSTTGRIISAKVIVDEIIRRLGIQHDLDDALYAPIAHTHPISDITGLQAALNNKVDKTTTITGGYGVSVSGNLSTSVSVELNTTIIDDRYIRKDISDNNGSNTLILGSLVSGSAIVNGSLTLPSLPTGTSDEILIVGAGGLIQKKTLEILGDWGVANNAGAKQFDVSLGSDVRFSGTGDTVVSFDPVTNTIIINSAPGQGGGGAVTSFNGRTGGVVPISGDYTTSIVSEGTNLYYTEARTLSTVLTGLPAPTNTSISETDSILQALAKLQGQTSGRANSATTLTINGTAGNIVISGGSQSLEANRSWTVNLASSGVAAGTYPKVTVDTYGRVTAGVALSSTDIPDLPASKITTGVFNVSRLGSGAATAGTYVDGATGAWTSLPTTDLSTYYTKTETDTLLGGKFDNPTGTANQYIRGDGTISAFPAIPAGTVTSVGISVPSALLAVTGSPVTSNGTFTVTLPNRSSNTVFAGPATGTASSPTFRALVAADIPSLNASKITTGIFTTARLGSGTATANNFLAGDGSWKAAIGTTYTGANGINITGTVISPTYGTTSNTVAQGNDPRINNGQTAFGWGNFRDFGLGKSTLTGWDWTLVNQPTQFIATETTTQEGRPPGLQFPMGIHINRSSNVEAQLALGHDNTGIAYRSKQGASVWMPWITVWTNSNLTKLSDLTNDLPSQIQTLSLGTTAGNIAISEGNSIDLRSLRHNAVIDINEIIYPSPSLYPVLTESGSTGYPSGTGSGIKNQRLTNRTSGDFEIWKEATNTGKIMFNRATSSTTWNGWETFASEEWTNDNFIGLGTGTGGDLPIQTIDANSIIGTNTLITTSSSTNIPIAGNGVLFTSQAVNSSGFQTLGNASNVDGYWYRGKSSLAISPWYQVASREWVLNQNYSTTTYTAGSGIDISANNVISNTSPNLPSNLALDTRSTTTQAITNSNGTGFILPSATTDLSGLMSSSDKTKLDGIEEGANNYILPVASETVSGGIIVGSGLSISDGVLNNDSQNITQSLSISGSTITLSNGGGSVTVPNTTYTAGTASQLNTGTATTNHIWSPKIIADYVKGWNTAGVGISISATGVITNTSPNIVQTTITGNAGSATRLQTARTINGVSFDGTANIVVSDDTKEPAFAKNTAFNKNFGTVLGTVLDGAWRPDWDDVTGKPTEFTPSAHTHTISEVIDLQTALNNKVNTSLPITNSYGITIGGSLSTSLSLGVDTTVLDTRYLRKDADDDNGVNTLTLDNLIALTATIESSLNLPSLSTGTSDEILIVGVDGLIQKKTLEILGSFGISNSTGVKQFDVNLGSDVRFEGTGDTAISYNPTTNTVIINSVPGQGGGGAVTSFNGRSGAVNPAMGDYTTSIVSEGDNLYHTDIRVRSTSLTGLPALTNTSILSTDSILQAFSKTQGQINAKASSGTSITVNGTAGRVLVSGATQDLTSNRTWTVDLVNGIATAGTYQKVTIDTYGRVISGSSLDVADIPNLPASKITSGIIDNARLGSGTAGAGAFLGSNGWAIPPNTNTTYSGSTSITLSGTSFQRAALTGDITAASNSNATTISPLAVTFDKFQNVDSQVLLGRGLAGRGNIGQITLGANLNLTAAGVLSATNTNTTYSPGTGLSLSGTTFNVNFGVDAGTVAQGDDSRIINGQTAYNWGDPTGRFLPFGLNTTNITKSITADLNTITDSVFYSNASSTNRPFDTNATIISLSGSTGYGGQIGFTANNARGLVYRKSVNNVWGGWNELWDSSNLRSNTQNDSRYVLKSGDTMTGILDFNIAAASGMPTGTDNIAIYRASNPSATGGSLIAGRNSSGSESFLLRNYSASGYQLTLNQGGISASGAVEIRSTGVFQYLTRTDANGGTIEVGKGGDGTPFYFRFNAVGGGSHVSYEGASQYRFDSTITSTGDVLSYTTSDLKLKDFIKTITNPIDKISKISGNSFKWNDKQDTYEVGLEDYGVIAQEIEEVLPHAVTTRTNGYKAVKYDRIIPLLIEGIKEQTKLINKLQEEVIQLKGGIN